MTRKLMIAAAAILVAAAPSLAEDVPFDGDPLNGSVIVSRADGLLSWVKHVGGNLGGIFTGNNQGAGVVQEIDIGDIDGDGNGDILTARDDGASGSTTWTERSGGALGGVAGPFNIGSPATTIAVGNLDFDGNGDWILGRGDGHILWAERIGNNITANNPSFNVGGANSVAIGNMDGDGDGDVVVGRSDGLLTWVERNGNNLSGVFTGFNVTPSVTLEIGNLDNDGDGDIVIGRQDGFVTWAERAGGNITGGGGLANPNFNMGSVADLALCDANGDGDQEVIVAQSASGGGVGILDHNGLSISLVSNLFQAVGNSDQITSLDCGDLDADGLLDIVVGRTDGFITWMEANAAGTAISGIANFNMGSSVVDLRIASVPEPSTLALLAVGGFGLLRRRRRA